MYSTYILTSIIHQCPQDLFPLQSLLPRAITGLAQRQVHGNLPLALVQKARLLWAVGQTEPGDDRQQTGRDALDDEQDAPGPDGPFGLRDAVGERAAVRVGGRRTGEEDAGAQAQLLARVEEGQVQGHAGPVGGFEDGQDHTTHHDAGPGRACRLERRDDAPAKHHKGDPGVRWEGFPAHLRPLEQDVWARQRFQDRTMSKCRAYMRCRRPSRASRSGFR